MLPAATTRSKSAASWKSAGSNCVRSAWIHGSSGRLPPGDSEHGGVDVHADAVVTEFHQPDHDASRAAARVQHPRPGGHQGRAEPRFAVRVLAAAASAANRAA